MKICNLNICFTMKLLASGVDKRLTNIIGLTNSFHMRIVIQVQWAT